MSRPEAGGKGARIEIAGRGARERARRHVWFDFEEL
jgi:hypothetical protein